MVNGRQSGKNRNPQYQNIERKPAVKKDIKVNVFASLGRTVNIKPFPQPITL